MSNVSPEVRGIRKMIGLFIIFQFTKWYITGEFWIPLVQEVSQATYGSPITDALDMVSAITYLVGTVACLAADKLWDFVVHLFSAVRKRVSGVRTITEFFDDGKEAVENAVPDPVVERINQLTEIVNRLSEKIEGKNDA